MKIVNKSFVESLAPTGSNTPRQRLNRMLGNLTKGTYLFIGKKELEAKGYKSHVGLLVDKKIKSSVSIKGYKRGWVISKR